MSVIRWKTGVALLRVVSTSDNSSSTADQSYVPTTPSGILRWLQLISDGCEDRDFLNYPFRVVYSHSISSPSPSHVEIRIQGILNIGALIHGIYVSRPKCVGDERVRWMKLVHGNDNDKEKFEEQIIALRRIADACKAQLSLPPSHSCLPTAIYLRRRQPESGSSVAPLSVLRLDALSGLFHPLSVHDLRRGDLLDVNVFIDVTVYRAEDSIPRAVVYFSFNRIIRLATISGSRGQIGAFLKRTLVDDRYSEMESIGHTVVEAINLPLDSAQERLQKSLPPPLSRSS